MAFIEGNHYFVFFVNDSSKRCWVYTMSFGVVCGVKEKHGEEYTKED